MDDPARHKVEKVTFEKANGQLDKVSGPWRCGTLVAWAWPFCILRRQLNKWTYFGDLSAFFHGALKLLKTPCRKLVRVSS